MSDLGQADGTFLLRVARAAIGAHLEGRAYAIPQDGSTMVWELGCAFVTLHKATALRGCIGNLKAHEPLVENVRHNAVKAACEDPRFAPLSAAELPEVDLEVSCLSAPVEIASLDQFEVGKHGIILTKRSERAVFLPQVATNFGWDKETTLDHLTRKAGLPVGGWRDGAAFSVFTTTSFAEDHV